MSARPLSAAEHLEAALRLAGFDTGHWTLTVDAQDGVLRRAIGEQRAAKVGLNREQLDVEHPRHVGESAA